MRKLHLFHAIALLIIFAAAVACTSSSTTTRTNPSYDQDYSRSTRSRQSSQASSQEGFPEETYRPPITLMMLSMMTGEVIEGESYAVIAVVDNPENRDLTYRWSVEDGKLGELPESMRADVLGFEEQLRSNKGISGRAPTGEAVAGEDTPAPGAEGMVGAPTGESAAAKPAGPRSGVEEAEAKPAPRPKTPIESEPSAEEEAKAEAQPVATESTEDEEAEQPAEESEEEAPAQAAPAEEEPEKGKSQLVAMNFVRYAALGAEENEGDENEPAEEQWPEPQPKDADQGAAAEELPEQVEETDNDDATKDTDEETAEEQLSAEELAAREAMANQEEAEGMVREVGESAEEFEGFKPTVGEGRLVEPEVEEEEGKEDESLLDAAPSLVTIETDKPYALWTPPGIGSYTIRCIVLDDKGNELTPERSFPVTVTKPEPKTELVWNTSQKLYEDDYLVVEVRVKNVPSFSKGLFTIKFDPTILSFRLVETGDFFPKDYRTSLFYAQPPNYPGKVTVAVSADEVGLPKGDGVVARTIFKVKETINDPSQLSISEVMSEESRYILDAEGVNVLPLVTEHPVYATEWTEPPERPQRTRTETASRGGVPSAPEPPSPAQSSGGAGGKGGTVPASGEGTQSEIASQGGIARLKGGESPSEGTGDSVGTVQAPEGSESGLMSVEERIAALEEERSRVEANENIPEEDRQRILADLDRRLQELREGGTE